MFWARNQMIDSRQLDTSSIDFMLHIQLHIEVFDLRHVIHRIWHLKYQLKIVAHVDRVHPIPFAWSISTISKSTFEKTASETTYSFIGNQFYQSEIFDIESLAPSLALHLYASSNFAMVSCNFTQFAPENLSTFIHFCKIETSASLRFHTTVQCLSLYQRLQIISHRTQQQLL